MPGDADKVKERLDLVELIGEYIQLLRAGSANFKTRCPFHNEKTPSFYVSKERQMWHCFGCGEGGDHFTFVQKMEGMDFPEALKLLAGKAGIELERYDAKLESERTRLLGLLDLAAKFYEKVLLEHPGAQIARDYVKTREIPETTARAFRLGFALDSWDSLSTFLSGRGHTQDEILRAGLASRREGARGIYDRFRGRLMFPISNVHGHIVGFTGRVLDPNAKEAKYVNSPETALYKKGAILYALDRARQAIKRAGYVIVVQGNMDAVSCHKIGMEQTVASSGTALTRDQLNLLKRFTSNILISFDADMAGESAAKRGIDLALSEGFSVKIIRLPSGVGKDPDDCIRTNPEVWKKAVGGAVSIMEYLFEIIPAGKDLSTAEGKKDVGNALLREIIKLPDQIEQTHWLGRLASMIQVPESVLRERLPSGKEKPERREDPSRAPAVTSRSQRLFEGFISLLLTFPEHAPAAIELVRPEMLPDEEIRRLYTHLIIRYTGVSGRAYAGDFGLEIELSPLERRLLLQGERDFEGMAQAAESEIRKYAREVRRDFIVRELARLQSDMAAAERSGDRGRADDLSRKYHELMQTQ